jgi:hypothetical protein
MRCIMFVCVDPAGETYVPEEDNSPRHGATPAATTPPE